jgi:hypothetical protein
MPLQNVFWRIGNSDPYAALSFDRLNTFPGGLFRHHLWGYIKTHTGALTREERGGIDEMYVSSNILLWSIAYSRGIIGQTACLAGEV